MSPGKLLAHRQQPGRRRPGFWAVRSADGRLQGLEICQGESNFTAWRELLDCRSSRDGQIFQETALQRGRGELCIIQQSGSYHLLLSAAARLDLCWGSLDNTLLPDSPPLGHTLKPGLCYPSGTALSFIRRCNLWVY